ncbi:interphotoreceptor matrix proteoglycan 2 [Mobula hypostoma]|uniref:interphotoreceptor matrix proteoglycan 2 n=1 Tax=Mobula hypostoma TaxID=723540 RepID=UPI002FC39A43
MLGYWWKTSSVFPCVLLLNCVLEANSDVLKGTSGERRQHQDPGSLPHGSTKSLETGSAVQITDRNTRHKRSFSFPSDIKLCPEETVSQAIGSYFKYYKLRVCQEAIWEAFKTFWDRLPERHEHQSWIDACNQGIINIFDIGMNFSQSEEHQNLIKEKVSLQMENVSSSVLEDVCPLTTNAIPTEVNPTLDGADGIFVDGITVSAEENENTTPGETEQITDLPSSQVVEFFVQVLGEYYTEELSDPATREYQRLADYVHAKIENVFEKFPGYQATNFLEFRKSQNPDSNSSNVTVHCTVTFDVDTGVLQRETLNFIDLNSKNMENNLPLETEDQLTAAYTITDFQNYIAEALHKENLIGNGSLTFNPDSLQFMNEHSISHALSNIKVYLEDQSTDLSKGKDEERNFLEEDGISIQSHSTSIDLLSEEREFNAETTPVTSTEQTTPLEQHDVFEHMVPLPTSRMFTISTASGIGGSTMINVGEKIKETSDSRTSQIIASNTPGGTVTRPIFGEETDFGSESGSGIEQDYLWSWSTAVSQSVSYRPHSGPQDSNSSQFTNVKDHEGLPVDDYTDQSSVNIEDLTSDPTAADTAAALSNEVDAVSSMEAASGFGTEIVSHRAEGMIKGASVERTLDYFPESTMQTSQPTEAFKYYSVDSTARAQPFTEHPTASESAESSFASALPVTELSAQGQFITETFITQRIATQTSTSGNRASDPFIIEQLTVGSHAKGHLLTELATTQREILQSATTGHAAVKLLSSEDEALESSATGPIKKLFTPSSEMEQLITKSSRSGDFSTLTWEPLELVTDPSFTARPASDSSDVIQPHAELSNDVQPFTKILAPVDMVESNIIDTELSNSIQQNIVNSILTEPSTQSTTVMPISEYVTNAFQLFSEHNNVVNSANEYIVASNLRATSAAVRPSIKLSARQDMMGEYNTFGPHDPTFIEHNEVKSSQSASQDNEEWSKVQDISVELDQSDIVYPHEESINEEIISGYRDYSATAPTNQPVSSDSRTSSQSLIVFFSLRVTNMIFSDDLFNKSSHEYKALEQRFLELLVPYLQSNLTDFKHLEILNFRNGSIIVNSRVKFAKPVPQDVTNAVYLILDDFCNTAYQTMNLAIDRFSLDVESGDDANPCKFQACNEYSECLVNKQTGEAECVCNTGYLSVDGLPCQSICDIDTDFCLNDGKCDTIPGQGAICRCRVGENWWYRGEHCEEYVSETLVVGIAITSAAGFLLVAFAVIFFVARTLRAQYAKSGTEDSGEVNDSMASMENGTKYNPMYESDATTGYSHYKKRYPPSSRYSSSSGEASANFSSDEIRHVYECTELSKEEIQDRLRIIDLYTKDKQFAEFVRQHQAAMDNKQRNPMS